MRDDWHVQKASLKTRSGENESVSNSDHRREPQQASHLSTQTRTFCRAHVRACVHVCVSAQVHVRPAHNPKLPLIKIYPHTTGLELDKQARLAAREPKVPPASASPAWGPQADTTTPRLVLHNS